MAQFMNLAQKEEEVFDLFNFADFADFAVRS